MNPEFKKCLDRNKIKTFSRGKSLVAKELDLANSDLDIAKESFKNKSYKWATIQCYYSMFHTARALVYNKGYREKSHYCLSVALRFLYIETKILSFEHLESLDSAHSLRENADYYGNFSLGSAENMIERAGEFLFTAKDILNK